MVASATHLVWMPTRLICLRFVRHGHNVFERCLHRNVTSDGAVRRDVPVPAPAYSSRPRLATHMNLSTHINSSFATIPVASASACGAGCSHRSDHSHPSHGVATTVTVRQIHIASASACGTGCSHRSDHSHSSHGVATTVTVRQIHIASASACGAG